MKQEGVSAVVLIRYAKSQKISKPNTLEVFVKQEIKDTHTRSLDASNCSWSVANYITINRCVQLYADL